MKIKKTVLVLLLPIFAQVLVSCWCNCNEPKYGTYTNKGFYEVKNLENAEFLNTTTMESIPKTAFGLRIEMQRDIVSQRQSPKTEILPSAYAMSPCECPYNKLTAKDSVTTVNIFTVNDFDDKHLAGSDVSDYFRYVNRNSSNGVIKKYATLTEFVKEEPTAIFNADFYKNTKIIDFLMMETPKLGTKHNFRIKIAFSDGRVVEATSLPINLI